MLAPPHRPETVMKLHLLFVSIVSLFVGACSTGGGGPGTDAGPRPDAPIGSGALRIEPLDHEATITGGTPVTVEYRAFLREGGSEREVTSETIFSTSVAELGSFSGATFTSAADRGGRTNISAFHGSDSAVTSLTLRLERTIVTAGTPADAPTRFGGTADPSRAPELVYPNDGVMVPPNLSELEFHYRTNGSTLFELHVVAAGVDLKIYFGCPESVGGGCIYTPDRDVWETIATAARGQGPITYQLRGVDAAGNLGETAERTITVSEEPITGGIYYWNAGGGSIDRFEFGVRGAQAERFLTTANAGASMCVGCHALSRDGRRIALGTDMPTTTLQVFDVASRDRVFALGSGGGLGAFPSQSNFFAFNPDATQLVASSLEGLQLHDANTGDVIAADLGAGGAATMPDFSPDGQHIVYVSHESVAPEWLAAFQGFPGFTLYDMPGVNSGSIQILDWNGSAWVPGRTLVSRTTENNFYPTYSPDGSWVLFNRSASNTNSMGGDPDDPSTAVDSELWAIRADGTGAATRLARASTPGDTWPKWDPTEYLDNGRAIFWFAWSSRRGFGLRYADNGGPVQLWMSAFDPSQPSDPGLPAFRLPFQDIGSGNHIAQFVTTVQRQTCSTDVECSGEFCVDGRCYAEVPLF
jgi:hypothetical protein